MLKIGDHKALHYDNLDVWSAFPSISLLRYNLETSLLKNGTPLKFCDKQTEKEMLWTKNGTPRTGYRHTQRKIFK